jgi:hypothetical protein
VYRSKDDVKTYGGDLAHFTRSRAELLLTVKQDGSADAHRMEPFREVDASQANKVAREVLSLLPVEDANSDVYDPFAFPTPISFSTLKHTHTHTCN